MGEMSSRSIFGMAKGEKSMVMEQVRRGKRWELPMHALHNVAPEIVWNAPPVISPDLSPIIFLLLRYVRLLVNGIPITLMK
jgi:hypothetical protein